MKKNRQKPAAGWKKLRKTSHSISYEYECICRWVWSFAQLGCLGRSRNIFCNVAHITVLKETSRLLRFHFQRRSV